MTPSTAAADPSPRAPDVRSGPFASPATSSSPIAVRALGERVVSIDAYRGLVMLLMMAEVLEVAHVAEAFPGSGFWSFLAYHQSHVAWIGCSLHDLIQPSFSFLVG